MTKRELTVAARAHAAATPEEVWAFVADGATWDRWSRMSESELELPGESQPDGIGAIRRFRTGRLVSREEVTSFVPPSRLAYRVVSSPLPIEDYRSEIVLSAHEAGTAISWTSTFRPRWTGLGVPLRLFVALILRDYSARLARAATEAASSSHDSPKFAS